MWCETCKYKSVTVEWVLSTMAVGGGRSGGGRSFVCSVNKSVNCSVVWQLTTHSKKSMNLSTSTITFTKWVRRPGGKWLVWYMHASGPFRAIRGSAKATHIIVQVTNWTLAFWLFIHEDVASRKVVSHVLPSFVKVCANVSQQFSRYVTYFSTYGYHWCTANKYLPMKWLSCRYSMWRLTRNASSVGILPTLAKVIQPSCSIPMTNENECHVPVNWLQFRPSTCSFSACPNSDGMDPVGVNTHNILLDDERT